MNRPAGLFSEQPQSGTETTEGCLHFFGCPVPSPEGDFLLVRTDTIVPTQLE
jgi:hypothetical protein